jgi:hypothetical protein
MSANHHHNLEWEFRPFVRPGKFLSSEFMATAEELLFLVSFYGKSKITSAPTSKEEFKLFCSHVHDGWKQAQSRIAELLTDAIVRQEEAKANKKRQHQQRSKSGQLEAKRKAQEIDLEILFLRRMLDVILWTILNGEHSTLRRLFVVDGNNSLSAKNIEQGMQAATEINANPLSIAICSDMLSMVHIGDLVVLDVEAGELKLVELKSGEKNYVISKAAEFAVESECLAFENFFTADFNEKDAKHYERAKRQVKRNKAVVATIQAESGIDQNTGAHIRINSMQMPPDFWSKAIVKCYEQLNEEKKWAITTIDECVHVGVYSDPQFAFGGFNAWMMALKCKSPIFNLMDSFKNPWVRPLGAMMLPFDLLKKILHGDILVIICLDIQAMIEAVNERQPEFLRLISMRETAKQRQWKYETLELNGQGVQASLGDLQMNIGSGFRDRVVFDQHSPMQLLYVTLQNMTELQSQKMGEKTSE